MLYVDMFFFLMHHTFEVHKLYWCSHIGILHCI